MTGLGLAAKLERASAEIDALMLECRAARQAAPAGADRAGAGRYSPCRDGRRLVARRAPPGRDEMSAPFIRTKIGEELAAIETNIARLEGYQRQRGDAKFRASELEQLRGFRRDLLAYVRLTGIRRSASLPPWERIVSALEAAR